MKREHLRLLTDASLTDTARVLGLFIASMGDGPHEIDRDTFRKVAHGTPSKNVVGRALVELELRGYVERRVGGRGHSDTFTLTVQADRTLTDSVQETSTLSADSVQESRTLKAPSSTTAASTATTTRGSARADDLSLAHLRTLLGPHAEVLDRFDRSAAHGQSWPGAAWGLFRPPGEGTDGGGTEWSVFKALPSRELQVEALAQAFEDFAAAGYPWKPRHFRGFVMQAVQNVQLREKRIAAGVEDPVPRPARGASASRPGRRPMDEQDYTETTEFSFNSA